MALVSYPGAFSYRMCRAAGVKLRFGVRWNRHHRKHHREHLREMIAAAFDRFGGTLEGRAKLVRAFAESLPSIAGGAPYMWPLEREADRMAASLPEFDAGRPEEQD